jgi:hypothetical protein
LTGVIVKDPGSYELFFIEAQNFVVFTLKYPASCLATADFNSLPGDYLNFFLVFLGPSLEILEYFLTLEQHQVLHVFKFIVNLLLRH